MEKLHPSGRAYLVFCYWTYADNYDNYWYVVEKQESKQFFLRSSLTNEYI